MHGFIKKYWPLLGIGLLVLIVLGYLFGGKGPFFRGSVPADLASGEGIRLKDIHLVQTNPDETIKWTLDAKEVRFSLDRQSIAFNQFHLKLETKDRPTVELEGQRGHFSRSSGEITLHGAIRGQTDHGYEILTEHAVYRQNQGSLETDEYVKISGPFFSVEGQGLTFDLETETLRLHTHVTAHMEGTSSVL